MSRCIGVRREDKSAWERRVPVTPRVIEELWREHKIRTIVQPSSIRAFPDDEFLAAGAVVQDDLSTCPVVFAIKEIPPDLLHPGQVYVYFSHVIKGQPHNMPMLQRILDLGCTLIDYEKVVDQEGRRLIFFGWHAGVAGMLETLWALGKRLEWEGVATPLTRLRHAYEYHDLAEAKEDVRRASEAIKADGLPAEILPGQGLSIPSLCA